MQISFFSVDSNIIYPYKSHIANLFDSSWCFQDLPKIFARLAVYNFNNVSLRLNEQIVCVRFFVAIRRKTIRQRQADLRVFAKIIACDCVARCVTIRRDFSA